MKWSTSLVVGFVTLLLLVSLRSVSSAAAPVEITEISHHGGDAVGEKLAIALSGPVDPRVFRLNGDKPRLVLDLPGTVYLGRSVVPLNDAKLVRAVRTGLHRDPQPRTRIVIDLPTSTPIQHSHEMQVDGGLLIVHLWTESAPAVDPPAPSPPVPDTAAVEVTPDPAPLPVHEQPVPSVFTPSDPAGSANEVTGGEGALLGVSYDASSNRGEMVLFHLNDFYPPTVAAIEKDNPRVLCEFADMVLGSGIPQTIVAGGRYVERITTTRHPSQNKVQVTIDLSPDRDYDLQQVFFKNDNLFVLIINELAPQRPAD